MHQQDMIFQLCENDEKIVRTYECTKLRRLLLPSTIGYLTITNKRIIFHSKGKSLTGSSLLINEMPLEDTAGVTAYLDITINWLLFAILFFVSFMVTSYISEQLPPFAIWFFTVLFILPFLGIWILTRVIDEQTRNKVFHWVDETLQYKSHLNEVLPFITPIALIFFLVGAAFFVYNVTFRGFLSELPFISFLIVIGCYFGIYIKTIGQQRTFTLTVGSKTHKGSGIYIPGTSLLTILTRDTTSPDTLGARPAQDAEKVTRELGALLMDIRQLGDIGIKKWQIEE